MFRKVTLGLAVVLVLGGAGVFVRVRSVLADEAVAGALARQLSTLLGQPVAVDGVRASVFPRPTVTLTGVSIGTGAQVNVDALDVGASLGGLLSRRIDAGTLHIDGARVSLPLPPASFGRTEGSASGADSSQLPVRLGAVHEVVLTNLRIVSRGRTLRGDIDLVRHGATGATIRKMTLTLDGARIAATGELTDFAGAVGSLDVTADALDIDQMLAVISDLTERSAAAEHTVPVAPASRALSPTDSAPRGELTITLAADRASMAGVTLDSVRGRAHLQGDRLRVDPLSFNLFGGSYEGTMGASLGGEPTFTWKADVKNIDMGAVATFAGNPGTIAGRLAANLNLTGTGIDAARAMRTARGMATVTIVNGNVRNLALVRGAVAATSANPQAVASSNQDVRDEPFSELGATLAVFAGTASTQDLHFISKDVRFDASGALKLDGSAIALQGAVRLSEELSQQATAEGARSAEQAGRITLPLTLKGSVAKYSMEIGTR